MADRCSFLYLATALVLTTLFAGSGAYSANPCGDQRPLVLYTRSGYTRHFQSPGYPDHYPKNAHCGWRIEARPGYVVSLYVVDLDLEENCIFDNITILDGAYRYNTTLLARFCGRRHRYSTFNSTGPNMYIDFRSDFSDEGKGFYMWYREILATTTTTTTTTPWPTDCRNGTAHRLSARTDRFRSFFSPNYPRDYPNLSNCGWIIEASHGYVVRLYVAQVDLETAVGCGYDSVSVFNGVSSLDMRQLLAIFCDDSYEGRYWYSTGRYMYISFKSDSSNTEQGFQLDYEAVPSSKAHYDTTTFNPLWYQSTTYRPRSIYRHNSAALIGGLTAGLVGGLVLLFVIVFVCRRYNNINPPRPVMHLATPNVSSTPGSTMVYQNNAMFVMANGHGGHMSSPPGYSNLGYSSYGDCPPAYATLQQNTNCLPGGPVAPPSTLAAQPGTAPPSTLAAQPGTAPPSTMAAQPGTAPPSTLAAQPGTAPPSTMAAQP